MAFFKICVLRTSPRSYGRAASAPSSTLAGEKKERKRDRQTRGKNLRPRWAGWAGHGGGKARGGWDSWEGLGPARGGWRRRRMIRRRRRMGRGGIIQNKCSVEEMVEEGTGRQSDEYA